MSEDYNLDKMEYSDEYFEYTLQYDGTWSAEAYNTKENFSVPREFMGKPVTTVFHSSQEPAAGREKVVSVKLSPGLREIGYQAFSGYRSLKTINIPVSVDEIECSAFAHCTSLEAITVGRNVFSLRDEAFYACKALKTVKLPSSLISIGDKVFFGCESLETVKIPRLVNHLGDMMFSHCYSLKKIEVDEKNLFFTSFNGALYTKNMNRLIKYPGAAEGIIFLMPANVTSIAEDAFLEAKKLKRIFISDTLEDFEDCDSIIPIPKGTKPVSIGQYLEIGKLYGRISIYARQCVK